MCGAEPASLVILHREERKNGSECICMSVCMYIYIYMNREKERESSKKNIRQIEVCARSYT